MRNLVKSDKRKQLKDAQKLKRKERLTWQAQGRRGPGSEESKGVAEAGSEERSKVQGEGRIRFKKRLGQKQSASDSKDELHPRGSWMIAVPGAIGCHRYEPKERSKHEG
jgi:hypothetical protein